jgi:hypothetical protein
MLPDPVAQGLFNHSQAACSCRLTLARLNKPRRPLLELKRVTSPLRLRHLRYPFALEQPAEGYVLRGQAHPPADLDQHRPQGKGLDSPVTMNHRLVADTQHGIRRTLGLPRPGRSR